MVDLSIGVLDPERVGDLGASLHQQAAKDEGSAAANAEVARWRESDERLEEKRRRENRAAWYMHYSCLAETFRARAQHFERLAEELCKGS